MIAFACLLIPPLILVCLRERVLNDHRNIYNSVFSYAVSMLALNGVMMLLLFYVFRNEGELVFKLNHSNGFAVKYIIASVILALLEPYVERFCRKKITLNIQKIPKLSQYRYLKKVAGVYALILFVLNFIRIFDNNFWMDEAFTTNLVQHSISEIVVATAADVHPPLYYLLVKVGYEIFGNQGWMFHLVSLVPCAVFLIFALTIIWKKFGEEAAIILITLAGLSGNAINYNVEVRMYSWAALFVFFSFYELYGILTEGSRKNYLWFTITSLAAAYTHYYALISVSFFYVTILLLVFRKRLDLKKVLISCVVTVVGYLPWFFILLKTFVTSIDTFWLQKVPGLKESLSYVFSDKFKLITGGILFVLLLIVCLYELGILQFWKKEDGKIVVSIAFDHISFSERLIWIISGIASVIGTICVGIGISKLVRPFFLVRYIYPVSVVAWMILSVVISRLKGKRLYTILLVAYMLAVFVPEYQDTYVRERRENAVLQTTLAATENQIAADDMILADHVHIGEHIAKYYYPGVSSSTITLSEFPKLEKGVIYWLIIRINDGVPEMATVYQEIERQGFSCEQIVENGNLGTHAVNIYRLR